MVVAGWVMASLYILRVLTWHLDPEGFFSQLLFRREWLAELLGALAWLLAAALFVSMLVRVWKLAGLFHQKAWLALLVLLCFAAFGEETSWGQKLFYFEPPEWAEEINYQDETNIHNLNISRLLGLSPSHPFYSFLQDASNLLNPLFFFICYVVFAFVPLMKGKARFARWRIVQTSVVTDAAAVFLFLNLPAYLLVAPLVPAADELYETALALGVLVAALDTRRTLPQWSQRTKSF